MPEARRKSIHCSDNISRLAGGVGLVAFNGNPFFLEKGAGRARVRRQVGFQMSGRQSLRGTCGDHFLKYLPGPLSLFAEEHNLVLALVEV